MNLFWENFWGKLHSTEKFERDIARFKEDMLRYDRVRLSDMPDEYRLLEQEVNTPEFKARKQRLKSRALRRTPEGWRHSPEYAKEKRLAALSKDSDMQFYAHVDPERFKPWRRYFEAFADRFDRDIHAEGSPWCFGYHYDNPIFVSKYSLANEQQANHEGQNTSTTDGRLRITTRKEQLTARAWDARKGFFTKEYDYTSDIVQTAESFRLHGGIFQVKLRCTGRINHACWLGGNRQLPVVKLFHYDGKVIRVGSMVQGGHNEAVITGLNPTRFHVYTLVWNDCELVWYINNMEVHRTTTQVPSENMYIALSSFIGETQRAQEGCLEVDWVRVLADRS